MTLLFSFSRFVHYRDNSVNGANSLRRILKRVTGIDRLCLTMLSLAFVYCNIALFAKSMLALYISSGINFVLKPMARLVFAMQLWTLENSIPSRRKPYFTNALFYTCCGIPVISAVWFIFVALAIPPPNTFFASFTAYYTFLSITSALTFVLLTCRYVYIIVNIRTKLEQIQAIPSRSTSRSKDMRRSIIVSGIFCVIGTMSTLVGLVYYINSRYNGESASRSEDQAQQDFFFRTLQDVDLLLNMIAPAMTSIIGYVYKLVVQPSRSPSKRQMRSGVNTASSPDGIKMKQNLKYNRGQSALPNSFQIDSNTNSIFATRTEITVGEPDDFVTPGRSISLNPSM